MASMIKNAGVFIVLLGIALALPDINSDIFSFADVSQEVLVIVRMGIIVLGLSYLFKGWNS